MYICIYIYIHVYIYRELKYIDIYWKKTPLSTIRPETALFLSFTNNWVYYNWYRVAKTHMRAYLFSLFPQISQHMYGSFAENDLQRLAILWVCAVLYLRPPRFPQISGSPLFSLLLHGARIIYISSQYKKYKRKDMSLCRAILFSHSFFSHSHRTEAFTALLDSPPSEPPPLFANSTSRNLPLPVVYVHTHQQHYQHIIHSHLSMHHTYHTYTTRQGRANQLPPPTPHLFSSLSALDMTSPLRLRSIGSALQCTNPKP